MELGYRDIMERKTFYETHQDDINGALLIVACGLFMLASYGIGMLLAYINVALMGA